MRKEEKALDRDDKRADKRRSQKVQDRTAPDIWALDPPRRALGGLLAEVRARPDHRQAGWGAVAWILGVTAALIALAAVFTARG